MAKTIRQVILEELNRKGGTIYRFAKELEGKVSKRVVYQYLSEGQDTGTESASIMLEVLGLTITNKSNIKRGRRPERGLDYA